MWYYTLFELMKFLAWKVNFNEHKFKKQNNLAGSGSKDGGRMWQNNLNVWNKLTDGDEENMLKRINFGQKKSTVHKHCSLVDKIDSHRGMGSNSDTTIHVHWNWTIKQMDGN